MFYAVRSDPLVGDTVTAKTVDRMEHFLGTFENIPKSILIIAYMYRSEYFTSTA